MTARSLWSRIALGVAAAATTSLALPLPAPGPERTGVPQAVVAGTLLGTLLFVALARARPRLPTRTALTPGQAGFLLGWAWVEETLWRRLLLGGVAAAAGALTGLLTATALFALAHREARWTQVATGAAFGLAYIATGRLAAAVASHAVYNVLVAGSRPRAAGRSP